MLPHVTAALTSLAVILSAPFMGQIRAVLRSAFPGQFATVVAGTVGFAIVVAVAAALFQVRQNRAVRYAAILGAVIVGATYSLATGSGIPDVDAVERVHFVEYGIITLLFYRAWRSSGDLSFVMLPILAGVIVGTLEEWFQWFIPNRVGEARDVLLNLVAIGCGLAFSMGVLPPDRFSWRLRPRSATIIGVGGAAALLIFAFFLNSVHLGHEIRDEEIGLFRSRYRSAELGAHARDRAERWRKNPPIALVRLSREDQYMDEGLWHIRRRNEAWTANDFATARNENRILEKFFGPVLDTPTYATPTAARWPDAQRVDAEQRAAVVHTPAYVSGAEPYPLLIWPRALFWTGVLSHAAVLILTGTGYDRRRNPAGLAVAV